MADDNGNSFPATTNLSIAPRHSRTPTPRSRHNQGYETGEPSRSASGPQDSALTGDIAIQPEYNTDLFDSSLVGSARDNDNVSDDARRRRRSYKPRSSGGFLLSNPIHDADAAARNNGRRRSKIPYSGRKGKSPLRTPGRNSSSQFSDRGPGMDSRDMEDVNPYEETQVSQHGRPTTAPQVPLSQSNTTLLDVDSTQIVNMALNLSESRRMAQRRNVSSPMPPRLAPLPDNPAGGSLKQHFQQQRRTSRNMSPRADRGSLIPRNVSMSSQRLSSPLQASFDHEGGYTYHFSSSTLNRAQKAKEHLELMAQYRRLLQLVPPINPCPPTGKRLSTSSPPSSPSATSAVTNPFNDNIVHLGRPYNPLQYIRNRKVRARERNAIDGEAQGFADVAKVTDWIDQAATLTATTPLQPGSLAIPPFTGAHNMETQQHAIHSNVPVTISNGSSRGKRPRIDWIIEPADMLADAYWLEQDDNKYLIEDRHYMKILPKPIVTPRPISQQTDEHAANYLDAPGSRKDFDSDNSLEQRPSDSNVASRADTEHSHTSTRERARQKLHDLRGLGGMHHKHSSSVHSHHDFLRLRRGSMSDTSDSESDRKIRNRRGTVSANSKAVLEKQMNDIMARESLEEQRSKFEDTDKPFHSTLMTPERSSELPSRVHSRKDSRVEDVDFFERANRGGERRGSPIRSGRNSLEVPGYNYRASMDLDSSLPGSPDLRPSRHGSTYIPAIGMDLSPPSSRPGSPTRNPFSKVKSIFRERSRERGNIHALNEKEEPTQSTIDQLDQNTLSPISADDRGSPERRRSKSPARKVNSRPINESHKSHKSIGSLRLGRDEQIGLRNIFKGGAKIDGIIRGGVSKVSDLIWKKDSGLGDDHSATSGDESETELSRGRLRMSAALSHSRSSSTQPPDSREAKSYLDGMPAFKSTSELEKTTSLNNYSIVVPVNLPSVRFERLKPPRIDVESASPGSSPLLPPANSLPKDSDIPDSESHIQDEGVSGDPRKKSSQLDRVLALPAPSRRPHSGALSKARHWSISDRTVAPSRTTQLSKREIARLRALFLSSGIKAMEISRRAGEPHPLFAIENKAMGVPWPEISRFASIEQSSLAVPQTHVFPKTAQILAVSTETSGHQLENFTEQFVQEDMRRLKIRIDALHAHVASDLIDRTRRATDDADECSRDLVDGQRLKVKQVVDIIDTMLRRRRRRFRWVRRAGWLAVEWVLVGFMWYVWFVVMIARIFLGIGRGIWGVGRWLLWL